MTKEYFIQLMKYNEWANEAVHSWLNKISDEQWNQQIVSSFNSIGETVFHIAGAEKLWVERLNKVEEPKWIPSELNGSKEKVLELWKKASGDLKTFVEQFDETKIKERLRFKRLNGDQYEMPYYEVLAHIINHSSYHRGQLVTMMRQAGFSEITSTDMLQFFRK